MNEILSNALNQAKNTVTDNKKTVAILLTGTLLLSLFILTSKPDCDKLMKNHFGTLLFTEFKDLGKLDIPGYSTKDLEYCCKKTENEIENMFN